MLQEIETRLEFLRLGQSEKNELRKFKPVVEKHLGAILDKFYGHVTTVPVLAAMFVSEEKLQFARSAQSSHWMKLFSAEFGQDYFESISRIGRAHNKLGLEPRWYIGGYTIVLMELQRIIVENCNKGLSKSNANKNTVSMLHAVDKVVMLDMELAISIYLEEQAGDHQARLEQLSDEFDASISAIASELNNSASSLKNQSHDMTTESQNTLVQATAATSGAGQASSNLQGVASAAEELSASISEITRQVSGSSETAKTASQSVHTTKDTVEGLREAAEKITGVVTLIQDIAEQTNLLALNATIEAARAGDAGKGFAVVASEVKALANQTSSATEEISQQVATMQSIADDTRSGIDQVAKSMSEVEESASAISAAVEEQDAVTREISKNATEAYTGSNEAMESISDVEAAVGKTNVLASEVSSSSEGLTSLASQLENESQRFIEKIRHAG